MKKCRNGVFGAVSSCVKAVSCAAVNSRSEAKKRTERREPSLFGFPRLKLANSKNPKNFPRSLHPVIQNPNSWSSSMSTESSSTSNSNPSMSSQFASYPSASYFPLPFHLQNSDPAAVAQQYSNPYAQSPQIPPPVKFPAAPQSFPPPYSTAGPVVSGVYSLPQYQQAQQLFQRDAQTITPEALESVKAALASSEIEHKAETKKKAIPRKAAGQAWEDPTLAEWPENDFRLFCGDLGNEVNDDVLTKAFSRFPSFNMARVVRDKRTGKTRGYGFVSFASPSDLAFALKEMNGKYVGNRPIKLRKSNWKDRTDVEALERQKNHTQKKPKLTKKSILHK